MIRDFKEPSVLPDCFSKIRHLFQSVKSFFVAGAGFEPDVPFYWRRLMRPLSLTSTLTHNIFFASSVSHHPPYRLVELTSGDNNLKNFPKKMSHKCKTIFSNNQICGTKFKITILFILNCWVGCSDLSIGEL